jgi:hypothetical protein
VPMSSLAFPTIPFVMGFASATTRTERLRDGDVARGEDKLRYHLG